MGQIYTFGLEEKMFSYILFLAYDNTFDLIMFHVWLMCSRGYCNLASLHKVTLD